MTPAAGPAQRTPTTTTTTRAPSTARCFHGTPATHSIAASAARVDERGSEVGLGEDEQDGHEADPDDSQGRPPGVQRALALDEHPGDREHEQELPELRRLEGEEAEADPAGRAVRGVPDEQDEGDHDAGADEDRAPVAPVEVGIDECGGDQHDAAHARIHDLAVEVVGRVAGDRELRDAGDAPQPNGDESRHAREQDPVEGADDGEQARSLTLGAEPCAL